jgi:hypothetical protein
MESKAYGEGIRNAYQGELVGEKLYRDYSERISDPRRREKLAAIADIERATHLRLEPIAERLQVRPSNTDWHSIVQRRLGEIEKLSWRDLLRKALREWPPYIERFEAVHRLAPAADAPCTRLLVEHELVLVEFIRLESADPDGADSMSVLQRFLAQAPWNTQTGP